MICIIGSGLSAVAAAAALVRRGHKPTILDTGLAPESESLEWKAILAALEPENWPSGTVNSVRRIGPFAVNGIPRKLCLGSDFTYRQPRLLSDLHLSQASMHRSYAAGGFSNVWGAVIQPYSADDFLKWPVALEEMSPHYAAVRRIFHGIPVPSEPNIVGDSEEPDLALRPSSQSRALVEDLRSKRQELHRKGIRFGYPELAVRAGDHGDNKGCCYCGMCLHGCPYDRKYSAQSTLDSFVHDGRVDYISGVLVDRVLQDDGRLRIECRSLKDSAPRVFPAHRVFLAAGLLETSRIIIGSLQLHGIPFRLAHSDIFTLPIVRFNAVSGVTRENIHTLCQLVVDIEDPAICGHPVHLQFYGYNDLLSMLLERNLGSWIHILKPVLRRLQSRLFVAFGYLHSEVSSSVTLTLSSGLNPIVRLEGHRNDLTEPICRAVSRKLFQFRREFRSLPLWARPRLDLPGGGHHSGGIFPMRKRPGEFETDRLGALASLPNLHIVDTSVFPEIPPAPIAFTAMANAHRIASEVVLSYEE